MTPLPGWLALLLAALAFAAPLPAAAQSGAVEYRVPPEPLASALEAPATPLAVLSPTRRHVALLQRGLLPPIAELAEPELRIAGMSVNPRTSGPGRTAYYSGILLQPIDGGQARRVALPDDARLFNARWSPDGLRIAFLMIGDDSVELWIADTATGSARRIASNINAAFPGPFAWFADGRELLVRKVPGGRAAAPMADRIPQGPVVRETGARVSVSSTIQNLIASAEDERAFLFYGTSQLAIVPVAGGKATPVGEPALIVEAAPSPGGRHILQRRLKRPFSYSLPYSAFAEEIAVVDRRGRRVRTIVDRAKPLASLALPPGLRSVGWRADAPATLAWIASQDPSRSGDDILLLDAPFSGAPRIAARTDFRVQHLLWSADGMGIAGGVSLADRSAQWRVFDPDGEKPARALAIPNGARPVEWQDGTVAMTPDGDGALLALRDGIARLDLRTGAMTTLWTNDGGEQIVDVLDPDGGRVLSWVEGPDRPPNLHVRSRDGADIALTRFRDPLPAYAAMQAETIAYRRSDGKSLGGTLFLPAGYRPGRDGALPLLIWAYPNVVEDGARRSPPGNEADRHFHRPVGFDAVPQMITGRGYAVLRADMPVFGTDANPANDSFVPQIVANAQAAIDALVERGIASRDRVAIGGHSYGAGMAAALLANSDLFRTGIALSGAYNRTLTPFGFQASERRNFWEAPDAYLAMSAFVHADRIDEPILLVHGEADSNSGTYPMQSERLYDAISGLGGTARLVLLPQEDHQYRARESLMHLMWEIDRWLAEHLKPPARPQNP